MANRNGACPGAIFWLGADSAKIWHWPPTWGFSFRLSRTPDFYSNWLDTGVVGIDGVTCETAMSNSKRKVVVVSGGSRGIGAATVLLAAQSGWDICLNYVNDAAAAQTVASQARAFGARVEIVQADVGVEADVVRLFKTCDAHFGQLDGLVNNAGVVDRAQRVQEYSAARLERMFRVNVLSAFFCAREAINRMSTAQGGQGGVIVNVSSVAARLGSPNEYVDYAASKAALDTMTIGLAKEVAGQGIRVNAVRPGITLTDIHASGGEPGRAQRLQSMIPMQRAGTAQEVAQAILYFMSDASTYCTGSVLDVGGGR
jgi:NAD(P)-dependent dehydrogenase (short-subunit alcohol dehydrogenase family)